MKKAAVIKKVNLLLLLSFVVQVISTALMLIYSSGRFGHVFTEIHEINGSILFSLALVHVILFWPVVKKQYFKK